MLAQLPGGHILLASRREVDWRRLAVRSRAWSSVLPATAPTMTTDSVVQHFHLVRLTRSGRITRRAARQLRTRDPGTWSSSACRSCSVTPLVGSVVYHSTPFPQQRRIHRALAAAGDAGQHPDRVAWHLGMAARGPDDAVAARLEQAAERAHVSAGPSARQPPFAPGRVSTIPRGDARPVPPGRSREPAVAG